MIETCPTAARRFQFGIKTLLAIALLVCVCCGVTGWSLIQHPLDFVGRCALLAVVHVVVMWSLLGGGFGQQNLTRRRGERRGKKKSMYTNLGAHFPIRSVSANSAAPREILFVDVHSFSIDPVHSNWRPATVSWRRPRPLFRGDRGWRCGGSRRAERLRARRLREAAQE